MMTLERPKEASLIWAHGPFYPDALEQLAAAIAASQPRDKVDLDLHRWCMRAGVLFGEDFGFKLADGYEPWLGVKLYASRAGEVWLTLPHLVDNGEGCKVFERSPAFYTRQPVSSKTLAALAARLASTYGQE